MLIFDQLKREDRDLRTISFVVLAGVLLLLGGLWYVQILSWNRFEAELKTQSYRTIRVPAIRGKILDRNGIALAENKPIYSINIYLDELRGLFKQQYYKLRPPAAIRVTVWTRIKQFVRLQKATPVAKWGATEEAALNETARYMVVSNLAAQVFEALHLTNQPPLNPEEFRHHYQQSLALPMPMIVGLKSNEIALFIEQCAHLPGLNLDVVPGRSYPLAGMASHLVGYVQPMDPELIPEGINYRYLLPDYEGSTGIEGKYDTELRGHAGSRAMLVNNRGYRQSETTTLASETGQNVILTIDAPLQQEAEKAMRTVRIDGEAARGAVVVMDCRSGDILALVSSPTFNPNDFFPHKPVEVWRHLSEDPNLPLFNRTTYGAYPPGSIFKIITGLAILQTGAATASDVMTNANDKIYWVGKRPIKDLAPPGVYNFDRGFRKSSNSYFIHFGLRAGVESIVEIGRQFFLAEKVNILPLQEVKGEFPRTEDLHNHWFDGHTANLCIGQGAIAVTPVQMAVMTSAIANGGKVFWPRLVDRIVNSDEAGTQESKTFLAGHLRGELKVEPHNLEIVRTAMRDDVKTGDSDEPTGKLADVAGMEVCGKTGTAQVSKGNFIDHVTWFVSFAPLSAPRYTVVVMVESGASGGGTCAPVAAKIYEMIKKREQQRPAARPPLAVANVKPGNP